MYIQIQKCPTGISLVCNNETPPKTGGPAQSPLNHLSSLLALCLGGSQAEKLPGDKEDMFTLNTKPRL